jgi:hypothetical protein
MKSSWILVCLLLLVSLSVYAQEFNITIDAQKDAYYNTLTGPNDGWVWIPSVSWANTAQPLDDIDLSANWYSAWDETYLYIYEEISDDALYQNQTTWWANDCVDIKIDPDVTVGTGSGQPTVFCATMTCMDSADAAEIAGVRNIVQIESGWWAAGEMPTPEDYARTFTDNGYALELRLKWEWILSPDSLKGPIQPAVGNQYGFAMLNHDNDLGTGRDGSIIWAAVLTDAVWNNCANHGYIELLADHKIKYVPENLRNAANVNPNPEWYIPGATAVSQQSTVVKNFALRQNYPNPFNPTTSIQYSVPSTQYVSLKVYDVLGRELSILVSEVKPPGSYTVKWDAHGLASGVYFYRMQAGQYTETRKLALLR